MQHRFSMVSVRAVTMASVLVIKEVKVVKGLVTDR